jgi:ribokinase
VVRGLVEAAGVDCEHLAVSPRPTAVAVIGVDAAGENAIIVASGANLDTAAAQVPEALLGPGATVLCQNEIRPAETFEALRRARRHGARAILNLAPAAPVPEDVLAALDVLVVNELEARVVAGDAEGRPADLARLLAARHGGLACVVTLGAEGCLAVGPGLAVRVPALAIDPVDTTGAGDAFVGALAAWLDGGAGLEEALRAASVAAGCACEGMGAQTAQADRARILARLADLPPSTPP